MAVLHKARPNPDTGIGLHDSTDKNNNPPNVREHASRLRAHGVTWYKILAEGINKAERVRIYREHGIFSIIRLYVERPHPAWVPSPSDISAYVQAGGLYFEVGNEWNLVEEWQGGTIPANAPRLIAEQFARSAEIILKAGGIPLVPSLAPGGNLPHREATIKLIDELRKMGTLELVRLGGVAIHPRPLNNPPDAAPGTGSPPNSTSFREWEWYSQRWTEALGDTPPLFATESGYSLYFADQNKEHPRLTTEKWAEYNRELYLRLNPAHPKAIGEELYCLCYWVEKNASLWPLDGPFGDKGAGWIGEGPVTAWGQQFMSLGSGARWNRRSGSPTPTPPAPPTPTPPTPSLPARDLQAAEWITLVPATVPAGSKYWRLTKMRWAETGRQNIFVYEPHNPSLSFFVKSQGSGTEWTIPLDKPQGEPGGNFPIWAGDTYLTRMSGPYPSDELRGLQLVGNRHLQYDLWYELVTEPQGETPIPPPPPPGETFAAVMVRLGAQAATVPITPGFALFDRIVRDGFIPNGPEVTTTAQGTNLPSGIRAGDPITYRSAENASEKRVYYAKVPAPGGAWVVSYIVRERRATPTPPAPAPAPAPPSIPTARRLNIPWVSQLGPGAQYGLGDCGPASAVMVARSKGVEVTVDRMSLALGLPADYLSASVQQVRDGLIKFGVRATDGQAPPGYAGIKVLLAEIDAGRPVIVLIDYPSLPYKRDPNYKSGHFVVVVGYRDRDDKAERVKIEYHDPYWTAAGQGAYCWIDAFATDGSLMTAWSKTQYFPQPRRFVRVLP